MSFADYTLLLIVVWFIILGYTFSQISNTMKKLAQSINMREVNRSEIIKFFLSALAFGVFLFLFIHRIYYLGSIVGFNTLVIILGFSVIFSFSILMYKNKILFKGIRHSQTIIRVFIVFLLIVCFLIPLVVGFFIPFISDPVVVVSPIPKQVSFERGRQIQDIADFDLNIKAVQGYAWNINIDVKAPPSFYIWFEGIENGTKKIAFLEIDEIVPSSLEIQPSNTAGNGTYVVQIEWSYESANGQVTRRTNSITAFIGKTSLPPSPSLSTDIIVPLIITIITIISTIIWAIKELFLPYKESKSKPKKTK